MKKTLFLFFTVLLILPSFISAQNAGAVFFGGDTPGEGFEDGDSCGYVMGVADPYSLSLATAVVDFDSVTPNSQQGCVDENGDFFSSSSRESFAKYTYGGTVYTLDFDYNTLGHVSMSYEPDTDTFLWQGKARIIGGTIPPAKRWLDFEWTCATITGTCPGGNPEDYYVRTDATTGEISGYAWNDYFGTFLSFNGLSMELPPRQIVAYVDILASDGTSGPDDVNYMNAPLADGSDYWRVSVQFFDSVTGYLDASDISSLSITPVATNDSNVYLNQIENSGNAIKVTYKNPSVGCTVDTAVCVIAEDEGSSFNTFVSSGAPTSNVLGLNDDTDVALEYLSDRDGCRWIYYSQWNEVDGSSSQTACPNPDGSSYRYDKEDVYFERSGDRNKYEIDYVTFDVVFAGDREINMVTYPDGWTTDEGDEAFVEVGGSAWRYYPSSSTADLSYRPRYQIQNFAANFDGADHDSISEDTSKIMSLKAQATIVDTSAAFQAAFTLSKPDYEVYYQMDAASNHATPVLGDAYLLIDTDLPANAPTSKDVEKTYRVDTISSTNGLYANYNKNYAIAYGQKDSECGATPCTAPTNTLSDPTAEQWVCDTVSIQLFGQKSCYYTEYLPHIDRHKDPESMLVIGAINSVIDEEDVLEEQSDETGTVLSVLGTTETINLRNKMYAQVVRYTLGKTATGGSFDGTGNPSAGLVELMNGRLVFAEGDVTINGFDGSNKTLVVIGGNVFINTNVTNGRMGVIVFKRDGVGGNVYVRNDVTDLYMNLFLDGSLFSYAGTAPSGTDYPIWSSDEERLETLLNQLYLKGSLVSRNTVGGTNDETATTYDLGDGTSTDSYEEAREYDLNKLRQYRLCYPIVDGVVVMDESLAEECGESEELSTYGEEMGYYNSFILEYDPADNLPIFVVESGLFN